MSRRDDLIATARRMFRDRGYRATGIDAILAESGAAKATLYSQFRSKDALTLAVLEAEDRDFRKAIAAALAGNTAPADRVLAVFDFARRWFGDDDFNGCMFGNAAVEFVDADSDIRRAVAAHKQFVRQLMRDELAQAEVADPDSTASQLQLLFEGAIVMARVNGDPDVAAVARGAAQRLISASAQSAPPSNKAEFLVRALMTAKDS